MRKFIIGLIALLFLSVASESRGGGYDVNHSWGIKIGKHYYGASELDYSGDKTRAPFTRVRIAGRGRDFQCRIEVFAGMVVLTPVVFVVILCSIIRQRRHSFTKQ